MYYFDYDSDYFERFFFFFYLLRDLSLSFLVAILNRSVPFLLRGSFLSSGLQPKQPQILHPDVGSLVLRTSSGTWHKQDLLDLENAFMHLRQHPLRASNYMLSLSLSLRCLLVFYPGLYSGSSPLLIKSSLEHPMHPQV